MASSSLRWPDGRELSSRKGDSDDLILKIKFLSDAAHDVYKDVPTSFYSGDAGFDLRLPRELTMDDLSSLDMNVTNLEVGLGIACEMIRVKNGVETNVSYQLYARSSIFKYPLILANGVGVIDAGYRGEIKAVFRALSEFQPIPIGTRLVQICHPGLKPFTVKFVDELSSSERGERGFGSTGH